MKSTRPSLVSEAEFLALPETMDRVELIDGEVIVSPAPTLWHQELMGRLYEALRAWARSTGRSVLVGHSPIDIRFAPGRILQPDLLVILENVPLTHTGPIDRIPELCIEVLSTNRAYDRLTKRRVYAEAGVSEYWVIEPAGLIERWYGPGLNQSEEVEQTLRSDVLPGFTLDVPALFRQA